MVQRKVEGRGHHRDAAPLRDARQQRLIRDLGKRAERRAADEMRDALDRALRLEDVRLARLSDASRSSWIARSAFGPMAFATMSVLELATRVSARLRLLLATRCVRDRLWLPGAGVRPWTHATAQRAALYASHMASYRCRFQAKAVRNAGKTTLQACRTSTSVCKTSLA